GLRFVFAQAGRAGLTLFVPTGLLQQPAEQRMTELLYAALDAHSVASVIVAPRPEPS
nr:hypothetical protein [Methylibium sp.]